MTSQAVIEGVILAAKQYRPAAASSSERGESLLNWSLRDAGTALIIFLGVVIGLTKLRGYKPLRILFQLLLITYLGVMNGDMISQAMLVGWAQSGVPWRNAGGLFLLTATALLLPITTRHNLYCTHLCPHGAAQQLLKNRLPWRIHLPGRFMLLLKLLPALLLTWCVLVSMTGLPFSLVDIEPFDAWVFRVAGWAPISVALIGLGASLFVPMAYCRYGCPTGALFGFLRWNAGSGHWSRRDSIALAIAALAGLLWLAV
jgi:polyferredoxin